jgi:zinc protease
VTSHRIKSPSAICYLLPAIFLLAALTRPLLGAELAVRDTTLANGLRVAVCENHSAPVVSVALWYKVGAYNEHSGATGVSHLLEHMMFKGTARYGKGVYDGLIEAAGGDNNAFTSDNYTVYWANLASDRYELELELEADRMVNLKLDSAEFHHERDVVTEERRLGENEPYDALWEDFYAVAYKTHPYRNPVIGWMDDVSHLRLSTVWNHYQVFYAPGNAVLVVVGDVRTDSVFAQAQRWFGSVPARPVNHERPVEPVQTGERSLVVRRDVQTPAQMVGYHVPGSDDPDFYTFEVLERLLMGGKTSRLYRKLVYQQGAALSVEGGNDTQKEPGLFWFFAIPTGLNQLDRVEKTILAELESLKVRPVRDSELTQVKNQVVAEFIFGQEKNQGLAHQIGRVYTMYGSMDFYDSYPARVAAVTADDIIRAARKYYVTDNRTIGHLLPRTEATEARERK